MLCQPIADLIGFVNEPRYVGYYRDLRARKSYIVQKCPEIRRCIDHMARVKGPAYA